MGKIFTGLFVILFLAGVIRAEDQLMVQPARKRVVLSGYTRSRTKAAIASEVSGKVLKVNYEVGQTIGDTPFIEIDPTFIQFQIEQVRLSLDKLNISKARLNSRTAFLQKEFERIEKLHQGDRATEVRRDAAAEELAQARLESNTVDVEINTLKIQLAELKERRARYKIFAPQGWVVVDKAVEPLEIIAQGTPLAHVADYAQLVVPLFVSSKELDALKHAFPATITLSGKPARMVLNWVNPEFNERTRKLAVELGIQDYGGPRRGGLPVELSLDVETEGLMVPKAAVINRYNNPRIQLESNGKTIPIVVLGENGTYTLISPNPALKPGTVLKMPEE